MSLIMWTIYDHPKDFPNNFVARKFIVTGEVLATTSFILSDTLECIRDVMLGKGFVCLTRNDEDDPAIIETWL
jgi:hypothetical protein